MSELTEIESLKARIAELERERDAARQQVEALREAGLNLSKIAEHSGDQEVTFDGSPYVIVDPEWVDELADAGTVMRQALAQQDTPCPTCHGRDYIGEPGTESEESYTCPDCGGSGKAKDCIERDAQQDTPGTEPVSLRECPVGLFTFNGELCFKSEYHDMDGHPDAYVVWTGEYFWGGTTKKHDRDALMVLPTQQDTPKQNGEQP